MVINNELPRHPELGDKLLGYIMITLTMNFLTFSASLTVAGAGIVTPAAVRTTFDTILP